MKNPSQFCNDPPEWVTHFARDCLRSMMFCLCSESQEALRRGFNYRLSYLHRLEHVLCTLITAYERTHGISSLRNGPPLLPGLSPDFPHPNPSSISRLPPSLSPQYISPLIPALPTGAPLMIQKNPHSDGSTPSCTHQCAYQTSHTRPAHHRC